MSTFTQATLPLRSHVTTRHRYHHRPQPSLTTTIHSSLSDGCGGDHHNPSNRRKIVTTSLVVGVLHSMAPLSAAKAENWGTRSFILERFFQPGLSPEDAVARIRQTAEGLHSMREMLDRMSWRYVIFYIRLKSAYLSQDLKNAATTLPQGRRMEYVNKANELVDNMAQFDYYVRTPKVYESYLYYEKTLKSLDDIVALLA